MISAPFSGSPIFNVGIAEFGYNLEHNPGVSINAQTAIVFIRKICMWYIFLLFKNLKYIIIKYCFNPFTLLNICYGLFSPWDLS